MINKEIKRNNIIKLIFGIFSLTLGIIILVFINSNKMNAVLGYSIGSLICLTSVYLVLYTFLKYPEHFLRYFVFAITLSFGVLCIINPSIGPTFFSLFLGITLSLISLLYFIQFIVLKKASMRYWFNVVQLLMCILLFVIGILICVYYNKIDTFLMCIIISVPLILIGLILIVLMIVRLIVNH